MAELIIQHEKIKNNIKYLSNYFAEHNIDWSLITKVFSGDKTFLRKVLTEDVIENINSVGDSRLSSLKNLKEVNPEMRTIYIKPPAEVYAEEVVRYADISLNSSLMTIRALNEEARKADKLHRIIIMIELGELREGVNQPDILEFYEEASSLSNLEVIGIGSNLGCMYGVIPTHEKLMRLCHYRDLISKKYDGELKYISGGSSITLPILDNGTLPDKINHFRVGEAAFFGVSPMNDRQFKDLSTDTFLLRANIIELEKKKLIPEGEIANAQVGEAIDFDDGDESETSYKAILDIGMLDVNKGDISALNENISFVGITSDMLVIDIGNNKTKEGEQKFKVGGYVEFRPNYMGVARLLNSKFIERVFVD